MLDTTYAHYATHFHPLFCLAKHCASEEVMRVVDLASVEQGMHIGDKRVVWPMKQAGLAARHRTHRIVTTRADPTATSTENVLHRDFEAEVSSML